MTSRRILPLLVLIALMVAPFGRMGLAQAAMPHHAAPMAMAGHCEDMPAPDSGTSDKSAIDCMIACAAMTPAGAAEIAAFVPITVAPAPLPLFSFEGIQPEAADPPPRRS